MIMKTEEHKDINITGNWKTFEGKLKEKYGDLANDDLTYLEGKGDQLVGHLQEKLEMTKEEALNAIKTLVDDVEKEVKK
jgi:uncharacterized protein YjbJ (UPF0337 family)